MFIPKRSAAVEIPIEEVRANPDQPRKVFEAQELEALSASIREFGVLQPIIVKKVAQRGYFLIAGERRLRAATMAGLKHIPAVVREADDREIALIALVENIQRAELNYIEEAEAYQSLMEVHGLTQSELSRRVGKQQSTISNKIRLLSLPEDIRKALSKHQLSERHARALLRVPDNEQRKQILERIAAHGLNVKQSEKLIEDFLTKKKEENLKNERLRFINYRIYVNTIKKAFTAIKDSEEGARYYQEDKGDHLEVRITIPKKVG